MSNDMESRMQDQIEGSIQRENELLATFYMPEVNRAGAEQEVEND